MNWLPRNAWQWLFVVLSLLLAGSIAAAPGIDRYVRDIHPRNVTKFLSQIEEEYSDRGDDGGERHAKRMMEYVENHYRYEDMKEHRGTPVAQELAAQRERTMRAIEAYIARQQ